MSKKFTIVLLVAVALIASASVFADQAVERSDSPLVIPETDEIEKIPTAPGNPLLGPPSQLKGPLSEGFEGGAIPANWTVYNEDGDSYQWEAYKTTSAHSDSFVARVHYNYYGCDDWLITPRLTVAAGDSIIFWAKSYSSSYLEDFEVLLSTTGNAVGDFTTQLDAVTDTPYDPWTKYGYDLSAYDGQNIYVAVRCVSVNEFYLYVDDFSGPELWVPAGPAIAFSTTDLDFGTVGIGGSQDLPLVIYSVGASDLTVSAVSSDNAHFTHDFPGVTVISPGDSLVVTVTFTPTVEPQETGTLTITHDGTKAESYIAMSGRGFAGLFFEDFETTVPPAGWTDYHLGDAGSQGWYQSNVNHDSWYARHTYESAYNCDDWLVTPAVTIPAGKYHAALEFIMYEYLPDDYMYHGVWVSTGSGDPSGGGGPSGYGDFIELQQIPVTPEFDWTPAILDLGTYAGETIYLAFVYQDSNTYSDAWGIDSVKVVEYINQPPEIAHDPKGDTDDTTPIITAIITDVEAVTATAYYETAPKAFTPVAMSLTGVLPNEYSCDLPVGAYGTVNYYIEAEDASKGLVTTTATYSFDICPPTGIELIYDDGTVENATCWNPGYEDNRFAVGFTPPAYPCTLNAVKLGIAGDWPDAVHQQFAVEVYNDSAGLPFQLIYGPDTTNSIGNIVGGVPPYPDLVWAYVCIDPPVVITFGDFYVAKAQVTTHPECEGLDIDDDGTQFSRSYWDTTGGTGAWSQYYPGERNLMIRAYTSQVLTVGDLQGTVTEATKGPIQDAIVTSVGALVTKSDTTDASGNYFIGGLPEGDYDVTAEAAGYHSQTVEDVAITAGDTTVQDFALQVDTALLRESFCGTFPPAGWTSYQLGDPAGWQQTTIGHDDACAAFHNDDNVTTLCDDWLVTPALSIPAGKAEYALTFWEYWYYVSYYYYHGVMVSTGSGNPNDGQFVELQEINTGAGYAWEQMGPISLAAYAGQTIYLAFRYQGDYADEWTVDDVLVDMVLTGNIGGTVAEAKGPIQDAIVTAGGISDTTDASGGYLIEGLTVGDYDVTATAAGYFTKKETGVSVAADDTTMVDFALTAYGTGEVLLVDADGSPAYYPDSVFTDVQSYFTDALDACGYTYDIWEKMSWPEDGPDATVMGYYDAVIFFTGEAWTGSQTLTDNDETELALYLDGGGKLFLSAQDYFYDRYPSAGSFSPGEFPYDYLGVTSTTQDVVWMTYPAVGTSDGYAGSVADGLFYDLFDPYTPPAKVDDPKAPSRRPDGLPIDELVIAGDAVLDAISGADTVDIGACQYEGTKGFKTVFTTVDFAGLVDGPHTRAELMCSIMDWLLAPPAQMWLSNGGVNPIIGNLSTTFTYSVTYTQLSELAPTLKKVYIDGVPYDMVDPTGGAGPYSGGVVFTYQHQFTLGGNHDFYFDFSDGTISDRLPSSGTFWGPMNGFYYWHFEDAAHFNTTGSPTEDWEWGTPTDPNGPTSAHSGEKCWGTVLDTNYSVNSTSRLETPPLDFSSAIGTLELKFWHWYDTEGYFDGGNVKLILPDTTILLFPDTTQAGIDEYPEDAHSTGNAWIPGEPGYSGHVQGFWEEAIFDLTPWANQSNVVIAWDFGSDGSVTYPGWFIDDVVIWGEPPLPVELASFAATAGDRVVTLAWETRSELNNLGFQVYRRVEDGEFARIDTEMIPGAGSSEDAHSYTYVDRGLTNGVTYYYQIAAVDFAGNVRIHDMVVSATPVSVLPTVFALSQNYPNPFNPNTEIKYQLPRDSRVVLRIYNVMGQEVATLVDADLKAGYYTATWNARDARGSEVSAGIYFCRLQAGEFSQTRKMVLIK